MKKRLNKLLLVMLVLSMLMAMFNGCGNASQSTVDAATSTEETVASEDSAQFEEAAPTDEAAPADEAATADEAVLAEAETPAVERVSYDLPLFDKTESFSFWCTYKGANESRSAYVWWNQMQEATNIDIDFVECAEDGASEKYSLMVAANDLTDLIWEENANASRTATSGYTGGLDKAVADEVYLNLTDLLADNIPNYYSYLLEYPELRRDLTTDEGNIVVVAQITEPGAYVEQGGFVSDALLEKTNTEMPATVEEWYDFWLKVKQDDLVECPSRFTSMGAGTGFGVGIAAAYGTTDSSTFLVDLESGEVFYAQTQDAFRDYLEFVAKCYNQGIIHNEFYNLPTDMGDVMAGRFGTFIGNISFVTSQLEGYSAAPAPYLESSGYDYSLLTSYDSMVYKTCCWVAISANTDKFDTICTWLDYMYSDEGVDLANFGFEEGVSYEIVNGEKQFTDIMDDRDMEKDLRYVQDLTMYEGPSFTYANLAYPIASEEAKAMYEIWNTDEESKAPYSSLPSISLTVEESEATSDKLADIETYVSEMILKFETGEVEITDATWAEYVDTINGFGLDAVAAAYQAAYERYLSR